MSLKHSRLGQRLKEPIRRAIAQAGYDLVPCEQPRRVLLKHLLDEYRINRLVDVGANQGQYALRMLDVGFVGHLDSFEPGTAAFRLLAARASAAERWVAHNCALGATAGELHLHIAQNSVSSSLRETLPQHLEAAPASATTRTEPVAVQTLDDSVTTTPGSRIWLKIDTQGYEQEVLAGGVRTLEAVQVLELEVSLAPLYRDQPRFLDLVLKAERDGFSIVNLEPAFRDPATGRLLQCDVLLARKSR